MNKKNRNHLLSLLGIFLIISGFWLLVTVPPIKLLPLFLGLCFGAFLPDIEEFYFKKNPKKQKQLIFHHYFFQIILALISLFIFTPGKSIFLMALLLAANIHLFIEEIDNYFKNPKLLQNWLFAREAQRLPIKQLKYYLTAFAVIIIILILLLIKSQL